MIFELTVPQFTKTLRNLSSLMTKAEAHSVAKKFELSVLLNSRLAPDQFNLIKQIQIATDTAKLAAFRLTGKEAPKFDDTESTWPELKKRLEIVTAYLDTMSPADYKNCESVKITQPRWETKWLTGLDYVIHHVIPNFYFHVTTAYSILRNNGVEIGKKDFLGELPFKS